MVSIFDEAEIPKELSIKNGTHYDVLESTVKLFAEKAYRLLVIGYRDMSMKKFLELKEQNSNFTGRSTRVVLDTDLTIIGLFGL